MADLNLKAGTNITLEQQDEDLYINSTTDTSNFYTKTEVDTLVNAKYTKPITGIPKTDMATDVQTSLGKADSALQQHQDISGKEDKTNKVTSISSSSTDTQYPSAKLLYDTKAEIEDLIGDIESVLETLDVGSGV